VTLELATKFFSDHVATHFLHDVIECCKAVQPTIERVKVVAANARAA